MQTKDLLNYIEDNTTDETTELKSGLYCTNGTFIPWSDLVTKYGLNIEKNYEVETYQTEESSAYSVFSNNNFQGKIVIDKSVTNIGAFAFCGCTGLTNIIIQDSVTNIGAYAFANCIQLANINISDTVTYIGQYAFRNCSKLSTLYIPSSVVATGAGSIIYECSAELEICCGATSKPSGWYDRWGYYSDTNVVWEYWNITREEYERYLKTGYLISDVTSLIRVKRDITNAIVPDSVTTIGANAFYNCTELTNIDIPNSVTDIGGRAFFNCAELIDINIPDSVTYIEAYAFQNCSKLTTLYIPSSVVSTGVGSIVYQCPSGLKVYCGATSRPSGWYNRWNYYSSSGAVSATWGVTREQYENNYRK